MDDIMQRHAERQRTMEMKVMKRLVVGPRETGLLGAGAAVQAGGLTFKSQHPHKTVRMTMHANNLSARNQVEAGGFLGLVG